MDILISCDQGRACVERIRELMLQIMQTLRSLNPNDTKKKEMLQEYLTNIQKEFEYLRIFYGICEADGPKFVDPESFIPLLENPPPKEPTGEEYVKACQERDAVIKELDLVNAHLVEIIETQREVIYKTNCEMAREKIDIDKEKAEEGKK